MSDRQLIADLLSALEYHTEQTRPIEFSKVAIEAAREYLRKPAQRTWQGLTDEEIEQGCKESWVTEQAWQSAVWWAEAKLKERNQ